MVDLKIEYLPVTALKPYERNARKHRDFDVDKIVESIRVFGFDDPIGVWSEENIIVEGHGRLLAAKKLGMATVPCIRLDHLTDEQRRAYALAHNKTAENSEWDFDILPEELESIVDIDMRQFGFDINFDEEQEIVEDEVPEVPEEPICKVGDLWQLGRHRLICGDSTDKADVARLMNGEKADMVFTDPPYNIASDSRNYAADCSTSMKRLKNSEWDKNFNIKPALENLSDFSKKDAVAYICTSQFLIQNIWDWADQFYDFNSYIVWCKPNPMPSLSKRHWTFATELIVYATRGKHKCNFPKRQHFLNFYGYDEDAVKEIEFAPEMNYWILQKDTGEHPHPTMKPVKLCAKPISFNSTNDDIVLDLFGGSGSTLIACEQLNRRCFMAELDPKYCDVIIQRWEKFTGEKAVLIRD